MQITMDTPLRTSSVPRWMVIQVLQSFSREWHLPNSAERSEQISVEITICPGCSHGLNSGGPLNI